MKNLLKNKKGFTLAEILLVIAIIVILSGATVIGVASWLNSSKATAEKIAHDAADFEPAANESVKKKKGTLGSLPQETETLQTGATENNNNNNNNNNDNNDDTTGGNGNSDSGNSGSGNGTGGNGNNSAGETTAAETTAASTTASTQASTENTQAVPAGINIPSGMETESFNDDGWGGNATVKLTKDITSAKSITVIVTTTDGGGFKEAWGINEKVISSDGNTITYTLNNGSNPYWTDPTFQKDGKFTVNYKFKDEKSHPVSIKVIVNN